MDILFNTALMMTISLGVIMAYDLFINGFNKQYPMWLEKLLSHALVFNVFLWVVVIVGFRYERFERKI